jgi:hypothetical protein
MHLEGTLIRIRSAYSGETGISGLFSFYDINIAAIVGDASCTAGTRCHPQRNKPAYKTRKFKQ